MSLSLFEGAAFESVNLLPQEGEVYYYPEFLNKEEADKYLEILLANAEWQQDTIHIAGKTLPIPRLQVWYGDEGKTFTYSGIKLTPKPWPADLQVLNQKLKERLNIDFSSVLVNLYRDGNDSVSWHSDDEAGLGINPIIASISLGANRTFKLRHKVDKTLKKDFKLEHGSLLVMQGETQHKWEHQVPKELEEKSPRINLTFRIINKQEIDV